MGSGLGVPGQAAGREPGGQTRGGQGGSSETKGQEASTVSPAAGRGATCLMGGPKGVGMGGRAEQDGTGGEDVGLPELLPREEANTVAGRGSGCREDPGGGWGASVLTAPCSGGLSEEGEAGEEGEGCRRVEALHWGPLPP